MLDLERSTRTKCMFIAKIGSSSRIPCAKSTPHAAARQEKEGERVCPVVAVGCRACRRVLRHATRWYGCSRRRYARPTRSSIQPVSTARGVGGTRHVRSSRSRLQEVTLREKVRPSMASAARILTTFPSKPLGQTPTQPQHTHKNPADTRGVIREGRVEYTLRLMKPRSCAYGGSTRRPTQPPYAHAES
eukprot:1620463-Rhodomonas_salina.1